MKTTSTDPNNVSAATAACPGALLLADDDAAFREMTRRLLLRAGYDCDTAASAGEVEARLRGRQYDLLISDIEMPGNSNLQMVAGLPQLQAGLPVILVTGSPSIDSAARSVGLAVAAYLIKPLESEVFLKEVARAIERYRCFRVVGESRRRLLAASAELEKVEHTLRAPAAGSLSGPLQLYFDLTLDNAADCIHELRRLMEASRAGAPDPQNPQPVAARPVKLIEALWETISVLEKTKSSFKSRELAELRRKLEDLVGTRQG